MPAENGPDRIMPAEAYTTTDGDGYVKIRREAGDKYEPISVPTFFKNLAKKGKNAPALAVKRNGEWVKWSYQQYYDEMRIVAKAFIKLGLQPRHGVSILGFNAPEWFLSELGAIFAGGYSTGIYPTNSPEACKHILKDSKTNILVVEDEKQYQKVKAFRGDLDDLKAVVMYGGEPVSPGITTWQKLMEIGRAESDSELEERLRNMAINECCFLVYTSGTTGSPKGVMLSHDNLTFSAHMVVDNYELTVGGGERFISYLPLSHVAANVVDVFTVGAALACCYFADKDALKGSLVNTLREVRPTYFFGVPRVWEKIQEKMVAVGKANTGVKKALGDWAKRTGYDHSKKVMEGNGTTSVQYLLANMLVYSAVKKSLGLDACKAAASAAAPLSKSTLEYFSSLDLRIIECYGMSEAGAQIGSTPSRLKFGTIGHTFRGTYTKLMDPKDDAYSTHSDDSSNSGKEQKSGEICLRGRNVMMGYLGQPEKTAEAIDPDGWLHSGDVGTIDDEGFISVTGRMKEILITAGGENVPPIIIEEEIKRELPELISNVVLIGDKKKFLSCLITLKVTIDPETERPTNNLSKEAKMFCEKLGSDAATVIDVIGPQGDKAIQSEIQGAVNRANARATSNAQKVQKWAVIPGDLSVATGELGPTLKVKRHVVHELNKEIIDGFYE